MKNTKKYEMLGRTVVVRKYSPLHWCLDLVIPMLLTTALGAVILGFFCMC